MAEFKFDFVEVNQGLAIVEADTPEQAERLATELYYSGGVAWDGVDFSQKVIWTNYKGGN